MSPWFGWVMDARLHLVVIVALIAGAIAVNESSRSSDSSWSARQVASLRQGAR